MASNTQTLFRRIATEPLVHFLLLGAAIYGVYALLADEQTVDDDRRIVVTSNDIDMMVAQWQRTWNRPPTDAELAGVVREHVKVQALYREALAVGLDEGDTVIERRLAQKLEMLTSSAMTPPEPDGEVLQQWFADNIELFRPPDRFSLVQIYFSPDERGDSVQQDADALLARLGSEIPADVETLGDGFMLPTRLNARTEQDLQNLFGSAFASNVTSLEPGRWQGPVVSGYGLHLVFVTDRDLQPAPELSDVRPLVLDRWSADQVATLNDMFVDEVVSRFEVVIEEATPDSGDTAQ